MDDHKHFLCVSSLLTGFDEASLWGTGCVEDYAVQFEAVATPQMLKALARAATKAQKAEGDARDQIVRDLILADPDLGPLARSLITLWYLGQWTPMPTQWVNRNGGKTKDTARILSKRSYREGLAWVAMGAHPQGAKQQGFGAWALEPPKPEAGP